MHRLVQHWGGRTGDAATEQLLGRGDLLLGSSHPCPGCSCWWSEGWGGEQEQKGLCRDLALVTPWPLLCVCGGPRRAAPAPRVDEVHVAGQCWDWEKGWNGTERRNSQAHLDGQWWRREMEAKLWRQMVSDDTHRQVPPPPSWEQDGWHHDRSGKHWTCQSKIT